MTLNAGLVALCPDTDADAVREIINTDLTDAQINAFLNTAYFMALPLTGNLGNCGGGDMQCDIIQYLAAHGITLRERQLKRESIAGEWTAEYTAPEGLGLDASLYGQQAQAMDCSGKLAKTKLKGASLTVTGYGDINELNYEDVFPDT